MYHVSFAIINSAETNLVILCRLDECHKITNIAEWLTRFCVVQVIGWSDDYKITKWNCSRIISVIQISGLCFILIGVFMSYRCSTDVLPYSRAFFKVSSIHGTLRCVAQALNSYKFPFLQNKYAESRNSLIFQTI